jgi:hypothetical protein
MEDITLANSQFVGFWYMDPKITYSLRCAIFSEKSMRF